MRDSPLGSSRTAASARASLTLVSNIRRTDPGSLAAFFCKGGTKLSELEASLEPRLSLPLLLSRRLPLLRRDLLLRERLLDLRRSFLRVCSSRPDISRRATACASAARIDRDFRGRTGLCESELISSTGSVLTGFAPSLRLVPGGASLRAGVAAGATTALPLPLPALGEPSAVSGISVRRSDRAAMAET